MSLSSIISKISMLGGSIVGKNSFAISYIIGDKLRCIRIGPNGNVDKTLQNREDIIDIYISYYFLTILLENETLVYTKYTDDCEVLGKQNIIIPGESESQICKGIVGDTKVFLYKTSNNEIYAMNYKGDKIRISFSASGNDGKILTIMCIRQFNRYYIGYGWPKYMVASNVSKMNIISNPSIGGDILMSFNDKFENIKYYVSNKLFDRLN